MSSPASFGPPLPTRTRAPLPTWGKVLLGCGIAVAAVIVVVVVVLVLATWWAVTPGKQMSTVGVVGTDATAVLNLTCEEDCGLALPVAHLVRELQRRQDERNARELPSKLRWLEELQKLDQSRQQKAMADNFEMWLPRELTIAVADGPDGAPVVVGAANFRILVRLVRTFFMTLARGVSEDPSQPMRVVEHGEHEIVLLKGNAAVGFAGGTVVAGNREDAVRGALDRLDRGGELELAPMTAAVRERAADWPLALVVDNRTGVLARLAPRQAEPPPEDADGAEPPPGAGPEAEPPEVEPTSELLGSARSLWARLRVLSADAAEVELGVTAKDASAAAAWHDALEARLSQLADRARSQGMELSHTATLEGADLTVSIELSGLERAMELWAEELAREEDEEEQKVVEEPPAA